MTIRVFITIDTEEDNWGEYVADGISVDNLDRIPKLQEVFDRYKAIPTYLVNYPVVTSDKFKIIKQIFNEGRCSIGAHCHPWNTPPIKEKLTDYNSMLNNLSYNLIFDKLQTLHNEILKNLGVNPKSFRAGRWGFSNSVAQCLEEMGYIIDTSMSPFIDWTKYYGPDYTNMIANIYKFNPDDIFVSDPKGSLLEVPPTIGFYQNNYKKCFWIRKWILSSILAKYHVIGILDRLRILNFRWMSPELCNGNEMVSLAKSYIRNGYKYLNMSFHSTSLLPGKGPYVKSQEGYEDLLRRIEVLLNFAYNNGYKFAPLEEAVDIL